MRENYLLAAVGILQVTEARHAREAPEFRGREAKQHGRPAIVDLALLVYVHLLALSPRNDLMRPSSRRTPRNLRTVT